MSVDIGTPAPAFRLPASTGGEIGLADYRDRANVVLFFVRAYNWLSCRRHVAQLGRMTDAFRTAGAEILVIMADDYAHVCEYAERLKVPFPVLADLERNVYNAYQLEVQFFLQRTASAIVDRSGVIRYIKRATIPSKWLEESKELLEAVQRI